MRAACCCNSVQVKDLKKIAEDSGVNAYMYGYTFVQARRLF